MITRIVHIMVTMILMTLIITNSKINDNIVYQMKIIMMKIKVNTRTNITRTI